MMLFILKNGSVFTSIVVEDNNSQYEMIQKEDSEIPEYPETQAGHGKSWELQYINGVISWVAVERPLTYAERIEELEKKLDLYKYPEWVQPTGAHDAYEKDYKVSHNGKKWINTIDANVWEPGIYGWTEVTV